MTFKTDFNIEPDEYIEFVEADVEFKVKSLSNKKRKIEIKIK